MRTMARQLIDRPHLQPARCDVCAVHHRGLCSALSADQQERLTAIARRRTVSANHYIFRDGDEAVTFASILSGVVKLIKTTSDGEQHIIGLMYAPEFLGHTFAKQHSSTSVAAAAEKRCCLAKVCPRN